MIDNLYKHSAHVVWAQEHDKTGIPIFVAAFTGSAADVQANDLARILRAVDSRLSITVSPIPIVTLIGEDL